MSVPENDWIWDALSDFVQYGLLDERKADAMNLEEAFEFVCDSENRRDLAHYIKWGVSESDAHEEMIQESYRW